MYILRSLQKQGNEMPETVVAEVSFRDLVELLLLGEVYDEANNSRRQEPLRLEPDKTLRTYSLQVGTDATGRERVERVDDNRIKWVRSFVNYIQVDPVALPAAEADLWAPGTTAADLYAVEFNVVNVYAGAAYVTYSIGHAVGGGALGVAEFIARIETIQRRGATGWKGPYIIPGNDTIRGNVVGAVEANVHWNIQKIDTGV